LNYEDEDYVRFYTRDTVSWMALGWEGQTVLALMLHGKFDRSGVFDCDGHTPSHAVTLVTRLPEDVAERGLKRLLESKTWVHRDGKIIWPKFIEAQTCRRSDRLRQRESRENRKKEALGQPVTPGDIRHTASHTSQSVTPSRAEPSRAEDPPTPLPPVTPKRADPLADSLTGNDPASRADVRELHADWCAAFGRDGARLRAGWGGADAQILADCIDAHGLADCKLVAKHAPNDGMVSGRDDERRVKHERIAYIFGNEDAFSRILRDAKKNSATGAISPAEKIRRMGEMQ
jgi:hypothetical protein